MSEENKPRISEGAQMLMIATASLLDLVQFLLLYIPVGGWIAAYILTPIAYLGFFIWFKIYNIGLIELILNSRSSTSKRLITVLSSVAESAFAFYPGWTIIVLVATTQFGGSSKKVQKIMGTANGKLTASAGVGTTRSQALAKPIGTASQSELQQARIERARARRKAQQTEQAAVTYEHAA